MGSSASLFYLHFPCSLSLGETIIYYDFLGLFTSGRVSLCSLAGFSILIFGVMVVFSIDAYSLFPQHVLVIIPLNGGVQIGWLIPNPGVLGSSGSSGAPLEHVMGAEVAHNHSWSLDGQWWLKTTHSDWTGGSGSSLPLHSFFFILFHGSDFHDYVFQITDPLLYLIYSAIDSF